MLVSILVAAIVIGVVLYILNVIPMDSRIKSIITVLVVAIVAIWAIKILLGSGPITIP